MVWEILLSVEVHIALIWATWFTGCLPTKEQGKKRHICNQAGIPFQDWSLFAGRSKTYYLHLLTIRSEQCCDISARKLLDICYILLLYHKIKMLQCLIFKPHFLFFFFFLFFFQGEHAIWHNSQRLRCVQISNNASRAFSILLWLTFGSVSNLLFAHSEVRLNSIKKKVNPKVMNLTRFSIADAKYASFTPTINKSTKA